MARAGGERLLQTAYCLALAWKMEENPVHSFHEAAADFTPEADKIRPEFRELIRCEICTVRSAHLPECEHGYSKAHWEIFDVLWRHCRDENWCRERLGSDAFGWRRRCLINGGE